MRRIGLLGAMLALLGTLSAPPAGAADPAQAAPANYDAFGFGLLGKLAQGSSGNVFVSPLSVGMALSMAGDGASGATQSAIRKALGSGSDPGGANAALAAELRANQDAKVGVANALWLRAGAPPAAAYVTHLGSAYGAGAQAVAFGDPSAARTINAWTKAHTLGLIDKIVDTTQSSDVLYLTNAVAFQGKWTAPFQKSGTVAAPFTDATGTKHDVDMMQRSANVDFANGDGFKMVRMPYGAGGFAAYVLLPDGGDSGVFAAGLTAARFDAARAALASKYVRVGIPRFTATYRASLVPALSALGMSVAFGDGADFTGIRPAPPRLAIGSVEHATFLHVDEDGTTAAAATSVGIVAMMMRLPQETFVADRPFVFLIRDEKAGTLLFAGLIREIPAP